MKRLSLRSALSRMPNSKCVAGKAIGNARHNLFPLPARRLGLLLLLAGLLRPCQSGAQSLTTLSISPGQPTVRIGSTTHLLAMATYADGSSHDVSGNVSWTSADPRMVSVSGNGVASGFATGLAAITASYQGKKATAIVASSIGDIQWSGPLTITHGGTYSGNWKSTDPQTSAVTIATAEPVVIQNSYVTGPNDLINDPYYGNNLTVRNVIGIGVNANVKGQANGLFVDAQNPALLDVEHCYFESVRFGVYVRGYGGNRDGTETVTILNNRGRNVVGLESDGNNGYLPGDRQWQWSHAFQLSNMASVPGIQIAWNEIVNYPYHSLVNENINMYDAGGTASSPAETHDNYIQGAYGYNPAAGAYNGGGFTTDGSGSDTVATASSFNNVYNNQIVGTVNIGIEFGAGHDNAAYNNKVISSGLLSNGTRIFAQNVGLSLYDVYGNLQNGSMYNNTMHENTVGWMCWAARCAWDGYRNDEYFPDNNGYYATNQSISTNPISLQAERAEYPAWLAKVSANGMVIGPVVSAGSNSDEGSGGAPGSPISTTAWYYIVNKNSTLCADASAWSYTNGTVIQQYTCGSAQLNQEWQFQPTDAGYYEIVNRNALSTAGLRTVLQVTGGPWSTANQAGIQLWNYAGATNQQWMPVPVSNGVYKLVARHSSKCLDVPQASSAVLIPLQQYDCNGTAAQSFTLQQK